ncbi:MAG: SAM-dependent DNA methyltransferase [Candidatus Abyssobacteria bacterium SURF_17]|uniref:site-specific DNA-methyltransferase (adenine-specific) n=1 Tax=Candidatus Abyssobacteria bacterium SURF_17 TaxID=2093361 RepID=A0A419F0U1_9BACT|nr:MAG: SAM-dependent DNA methyltransferase [Candidatus Abyssubacteria bacterium SURF_17]
MANNSSQTVQKLWNYCNLLRDAGLSYLDYIEQLTYLLFLKMADERTRLPSNKPPRIPKGYDWPALVREDGEKLATQYRRTLEKLSGEKGLLGIIFKKADNKIQNPALLRRLIADLIDREDWSSMGADVKGDAYEGLLEKNAQDVKTGAGQYFTPRPLIQAIVDVIQPKPGETICDPACGTCGFLIAAHDYIASSKKLNRDQTKHLKLNAIRGVELVDQVTRLGAMNLFLHGIGPTIEDNIEPPIRTDDSLEHAPKEDFHIVLTNPPFGKKSSIMIVNGEGKIDREALTYERQDFWATTSNKQLNFVQHVRSLLEINGKAAIVIPDNVLFEGGAGETIRRKLLEQCEVHTLLRLPTGIFYRPGVKANVLFFDRKPGSDKPWTKKLWIYDFRTNMHFTLKTDPLERSDLDDFVKCYNPENRHQRRATWSEKKPDGRWRAFDYEELVQRDKCNLDIFWLKDDSLSESENLPEPAVIAAEIAEDLRTALEQMEEIAEDLGNTR